MNTEKDANDINLDLEKLSSFASDELEALENFKSEETTPVSPPEIVEDSKSKLDDTITQIIEKVSGKLDLGGAPLTNLQDVLKFIDKLGAENNRIFDLVASKTASEVRSRVRFKATIAADILLDKLADMIFRVDALDYASDPMNFLILIEKYLNFIKESDKISSIYENPTVDESLKTMSKSREESKKEGSKKLTPADYADLVKETIAKIKQERHKVPKSEE